MARKNKPTRDRVVTKQAFSPLAELGVTGTRIFHGVVFDERHPRLTPDRMREAYRQMADNDPVVGAVMLAIEQTMRSVEWKVDPEDSTPQAQRDAEFVWSCIHDMSHSWHDFLSDVLTMLTYGWAYFEIVYKYRLGGDEEGDPATRSRYNDGRLGWRKFAYRSQLTLWRWEVDEAGGIRGMYQMNPNAPDQIIFIPIQKALLFRTKPAGGNPEGRSILRPAFRPWYFKKFIEELEGIGIERDMVGLPMIVPPEGVDIYAPQNAGLRKVLETIIQDLRADRTAGIILPAGYNLSLLGGAGQKVFDTGSIIARYDQRIAMSVLAQFIILGTERVGSYALASQQKDLFTVALEGWLSSIEQVLNMFAVRRLAALNALTTFPRISHYPILQPTLQDLADFLRSTVQVNLITPDETLEEWLRRRAMLPFRARSEADDSTRKADRILDDVRMEVVRRMESVSGPPELAVRDILPRRMLGRFVEAFGDEEKGMHAYRRVKEGLLRVLQSSNGDDRKARVNALFVEVMQDAL